MMTFCRSTGRINRVDLRRGHDNLAQLPFHTRGNGNPLMNLLFAALYDLIFSRVTRMGYLVPDGRGRTVGVIFEEKVHGSEEYLVSAKTIAFLKWLIYIAPYPSKSEIPQADFYKRQELALADPRSAAWRDELRIVLEQWYAKHPPKGRKRGRSSIGVGPLCGLMRTTSSSVILRQWRPAQRATPLQRRATQRPAATAPRYVFPSS